MKILQVFKINYLVVILITIISTLFIVDNNNKFVTASDKSISSVVTVFSYGGNSYPHQDQMELVQELFFQMMVTL